MLTNTYEIIDVFKNVSITVDTTNIIIEPSSDNIPRLTCHELKNQKFTFFIENNTLTIKNIKRKWYNFFSITFKKPKIILLIPNNNIENISIKCNTGNVTTSSISCNKDINVAINTGKINLLDITCENINSKSGTGNIELNNVTATNNIALKSNTGQLILKQCIANEISNKSNTGTINGSMLTYNSFEAHTNTGKITVSKPLSGCTFVATSKTGRITYK